MLSSRGQRQIYKFGKSEIALGAQAQIRKIWGLANSPGAFHDLLKLADITQPSGGADELYLLAIKL
jgi:hypothetical protein